MEYTRKWQLWNQVNTNWIILENLPLANQLIQPFQKSITHQWRGQGLERKCSAYPRLTEVLLWQGPLKMFWWMHWLSSFYTLFFISTLLYSPTYFIVDSQTTFMCAPCFNLLLLFLSYTCSLHLLSLNVHAHQLSLPLLFLFFSPCVCCVDFSSAV